MATQNLRIVGYLPPDYHKKLRQYMTEQSLTESAALIKIVKQFFDNPIDQAKATTEDRDAEPLAMSQTIASLKAEVASLQQRMSILEERVASGTVRRQASSTKTMKMSPPTLPPQSGIELARRFGVNPSSIEEAVEKGTDYFKDWSARKDPGKKAWQKRGELFYPLSS